MPSERGVRGGVDEVDAAIDELYANAPDAFTKKRDELAKRLKADGNANASAAVKALRKPTQIAYVLNQVARRFPDEVGELVDVGRELARAQRKALRGGDASGELRTAIGRQRDVVRDLTTKAGGLMREIGVSATGHLDEIAGALQAALVDPIVGAQLEEGRLEKVPEPATGFPGAAPQVAPEPEVPPPPKSRPQRKTARERQAEARAAKAEAKRAAAERAREAKERAKREAEKKKLDAKEAAVAEKKAIELARARSAADEAKANAETLAAEAEQARQRAKELHAEAVQLLAESKRLAKEAKSARRTADEADAAAKKSEKDAAAAKREASRLATKARGV